MLLLESEGACGFEPPFYADYLQVLGAPFAAFFQPKALHITSPTCDRVCHTGLPP